MIFVDANIPIYLVGREHPNKRRARELVHALAESGEPFVTDVEVYQEILHRYAAIARTEAIGEAFKALDDLSPVILGFTRNDVLEARRLLTASSRLSARDAIHLAVMQRAGVNRILSFDRAFDALPGIERVS